MKTTLSLNLWLVFVMTVAAPSLAQQGGNSRPGSGSTYNQAVDAGLVGESATSRTVQELSNTSPSEYFGGAVSRIKKKIDDIYQGVFHSPQQGADPNAGANTGRRRMEQITSAPRPSPAAEERAWQDLIAQMPEGVWRGCAQKPTYEKKKNCASYYLGRWSLSADRKSVV